MEAHRGRLAWSLREAQPLEERLYKGYLFVAHLVPFLFRPSQNP